MTRGDYIEHLRAILCYDSMIQTLSIASRYWLHREIISNQHDVVRAAIVTEANSDIMAISNHLINKKWKRPELRYNSDRVLEVYENTWLAFKPESYV